MILTCLVLTFINVRYVAIIVTNMRLDHSLLSFAILSRQRLRLFAGMPHPIEGKKEMLLESVWRICRVIIHESMF